MNPLDIARIARASAVTTYTYRVKRRTRLAAWSRLVYAAVCMAIIVAAVVVYLMSR